MKDCVKEVKKLTRFTIIRKTSDETVNTVKALRTVQRLMPTETERLSGCFRLSARQ